MQFRQTTLLQSFLNYDLKISGAVNANFGRTVSN